MEIGLLANQAQPIFQWKGLILQYLGLIPKIGQVIMDLLKMDWTQIAIQLMALPKL